MQRVKAQGRGAAAAQWADKVRVLHKVAIVQHDAAAGFCLTESHLHPTAWHGTGQTGWGAAGAGSPQLLATREQGDTHAGKPAAASHCSRALITAQAELKEGD